VPSGNRSSPYLELKTREGQSRIQGQGPGRSSEPSDAREPSGNGSGAQKNDGWRRIVNVVLSSYYTEHELQDLGLAEHGRDIRISRKCSLYGGSKIKIGSNVRIDDFCILSGPIILGSHIHIAAYCGLFGGGGITMGDLSTLSSRVSVYGVSDDYTGESLTNPTVPDDFRKVDAAPVQIGRHVIIGSGAVVLPGAMVEDGAAVGALSLVKGKLDAWSIYAGVPARRVRARSRALLKQEEAFLTRYRQGA
jgi:dTDP-4-amino-4,6-dideoxy-D-glucose acyltransferase